MDGTDRPFLNDVVVVVVVQVKCGMKYERPKVKICIFLKPTVDVRNGNCPRASMLSKNMGNNICHRHQKQVKVLGLIKMLRHKNK
jgi:hypothetical protein